MYIRSFEYVNHNNFSVSQGFVGIKFDMHESTLEVQDLLQCRVYMLLFKLIRNYFCSLYDTIKNSSGESLKRAPDYPLNCITFFFMS